MHPSARIHLSIGVPTWAKVFGSFVALAFIAIAILFSVFAFNMVNVVNPEDSFGEPSFTEGPDLFSIVPNIMGFCVLPFPLIGVYLLLHLWRNAAWLDGTVITKRGALLSRSADLATADISMGAVNYRQNGHHHDGHLHGGTVVRVPALSIVAAGGTKAFKIPLRGQGLDLLPASQLAALANALETNSSVSAERARAIGAHLRSLANDPLAY